MSGEGLRAPRGCPAAPSTLSIMFLDIISLRKVSAGVISLAQSSLKGVEGLGVPMGIFVMIYGLSILESGLSTGPLVAASLFVLEGLSAIIAYIALARGGRAPSYAAMPARSLRDRSLSHSDPRYFRPPRGFSKCFP
ncbi:MAG: DUF981 family protein [Nitrososphaeria archaeon]